MKIQDIYYNDVVFLWYEDELLTILCNGNYKEEDGDYWYKDGKQHREDGPAVEYREGEGFEWLIDDDYHRVDGPAIECANGTKLWFLNGKQHRVDGPAIELSDGTKSWYLNDQLVYSKNMNNLHKYPNLSKPFKQSIIKHRLTI
jgi:hypothetical protein